MADQTQKLEILMYHSVSDGPGPTCIPSEVFAAQIASLAEAGYHVADLPDVVAWRRGEMELPAKTAIITFDDGFRDFRDAAWPVLQRYGFSAVVFLPTEHIGRQENWVGANEPPRPLMSWADIRSLARDGASFGSHSMTHAKLPEISEERLQSELSLSKARLEDELGEPVRTVAPPYGATSEVVRVAMAQHYDVAVGTGFDRTDRTSDLFDLPRIEMFYFRNADIWRRYLDGKANVYMAIRRFARNLRSMATAE